MDDPLSIDVRPLTEERLGDYLRFFDEKARDDHTRGWTGLLEGLERYLANESRI